MSAIANSEDALMRLLDAVDNGKLRQVLRLVEVSGQRQVLEPALARLRPRIRRLRPPRPLTLPRLLTVPLQRALAPGTDQDWPFSIERYRLVDWHDEMIEGLDPGIRTAALGRIEGRTADDHAAVLEAGKDVWPPAAAVLAAGRTSEETPEAAIARCRAADLLVIAVDLVPLLQRLLQPLGDLDADERETVAVVLNLAEAGPPDRPGLLLQMLLRSATRPAAMAQSVLELAPAGLRPRLRPPLDVLLERHRIGLERRVAEAAKATDRSIDQVADALAQLADVLVGPEGQSGREPCTEPETLALRQQAAAVAQQRYATAIADVTAPLPNTGDAKQVAAVKARESEARGLARLGRAARRLAPQESLQPVTDAALRRLLDRRPQRDGQPAPVSIDDARLVEILAGPEAAWQLLETCKKGSRDRS